MHEGFQRYKGLCLLDNLHILNELLFFVSNFLEASKLVRWEINDKSCEESKESTKDFISRVR